MYGRLLILVNTSETTIIETREAHPADFSLQFTTNQQTLTEGYKFNFAFNVFNNLTIVPPIDLDRIGEHKLFLHDLHYD